MNFEVLKESYAKNKNTNSFASFCFSYIKLSDHLSSLHQYFILLHQFMPIDFLYFCDGNSEEVVNSSCSKGLVKKVYGPESLHQTSRIV